MKTQIGGVHDSPTFSPPANHSIQSSNLGRTFAKIEKCAVPIVCHFSRYETYCGPKKGEITRIDFKIDIMERDSE